MGFGKWCSWLNSISHGRGGDFVLGGRGSKKAGGALADGDALRASGAFEDAVDKYEVALANAEDALP